VSTLPALNAALTEELPTLAVAPSRDPQAIFEQVMAQWGGRGGDDDLWIFGYASLIWRPEFEHAEERPAHVRGYHRALKMWSRVNRGTPECPGLVFALLPGGSCRGMAYRVPRAQATDALQSLWKREMPTGVYDPKWLQCQTPGGAVNALAFTLSRRSPNYTGELDAATYRRIMAEARGRFGTTLEYATRTHACLCEAGIRDTALERLLRMAGHADNPAALPINGTASQACT
jgi:cation transport protein ChaC